jgi:hypothetical protein
MNDLNPELKKLLRWARQAPEQAPPNLPMGFSSRVVTHWTSMSLRAEFGFWQKAVWGSAFAAAALILIGLALLTVEQLRPASFYDVTPAYQVVSTEFVP